MTQNKKKDYFKETLKDYLSFSRLERRGLFAVIIILLLLIATKLAIEYWPQTNNQAAFSQFNGEVNDYLVSKKAERDTEVKAAKIKYVGSRPDSSKKMTATLFDFNPNGLPEEDWKRLGFSDKQIHVIKNYESKGGWFYRKEDVKKIYSISSEDFERIESYIVIPPREQPEHKVVYANKFYTKAKDDNLKVDVGTADTTELKKLRGIGTAYANRIVKYRMKLGGFYSINQLHEVWGINDSLFNIIADHVYIADSSRISKININAATLNDLKSHPYLNYNLAKVLVNYRNQHGAFKELADIKKMPLVDDSIYRKIAPYLKID